MALYVGRRRGQVFFAVFVGNEVRAKARKE